MKKLLLFFLYMYQNIYYLITLKYTQMYDEIFKNITVMIHIVIVPAVIIASL